MKGITRKFDDLGRIVIPVEIRRNLGLHDGVPVDISVKGETIVISRTIYIDNILPILEGVQSTVINEININNKSEILKKFNELIELLNQR